MEEQNISVSVPDPPESKNSESKDLYGNTAHIGISTTLELLDPLDPAKEEQNLENAQLQGNGSEDFQDKNHLSVRRQNGERRHRGTRKYSKYGKHGKHRNSEPQHEHHDETNTDERSRSASRERRSTNEGQEDEEKMSSNNGDVTQDERETEER